MWFLPPHVYTFLSTKLRAFTSKTTETATIDRELREQLMKKYEPEVEKLALLLERNLVKEWGFDRI